MDKDVHPLGESSFTSNPFGSGVSHASICFSSMNEPPVKKHRNLAGTEAPTHLAERTPSAPPVILWLYCVDRMNTLGDPCELPM